MPPELEDEVDVPPDEPPELDPPPDEPAVDPPAFPSSVPDEHPRQKNTVAQAAKESVWKVFMVRSYVRVRWRASIEKLRIFREKSPWISGTKAIL